jgi:hypothetical protein
MREGAALRAERLQAGRRTYTAIAETGHGHRAPRVRVGRWLVSVGSAIAGTTDDTRGVTERAGTAV